MQAHPGGQVSEFRTFFDVEVAILHGQLDDGAPASWVVFPDAKIAPVNARAYPCFDDACAAQVALWRRRRVLRGLDRPEAPAPMTKEDLFDAIRAEADSETVTDECAALGKYGARCYRQSGHEMLGTPHAKAHIGPVREGGPDATFTDDGVEQMEIWTTEKLPEVFA
jgi:hypothetical protein